MKKSIIAFVLVLVWGIMSVFCNSYKWKAQTGETRTRKDGTIFHVWDRMDLSEATFNKLKETDFKNARVVKRDNSTAYIIEKDGKQIVMTEIYEGKVGDK